MLNGKRIALGISGSIASYKGADIASKLTQAGAIVDAILTRAAMEFITPLAIRSLTRRPVFTDMFDVNSELAEAHVELARRADALVIAPATATTIARLAHGLADDVLSLTALATQAPMIVAPAMDSQMWEHAATRENIQILRRRGVEIVGPVEGRLASGRIGRGRLDTTESILGAISLAIGRMGDLAGYRIVVTAGGTKEPVDPVRYLGNHSSGKMGYALAAAARDQGATVALITAAAGLVAPYGIEVRRVNTAAEMCQAVLDECTHADALIMAAAVADFRPRQTAEQKMKKTGMGFSLELEGTVDILEAVRDSGLDLVRIGFAAESEDLLAHAAEKLRRKELALIVANDITASDAGFGADANRVVLLHSGGRTEPLPLMSKYDVSVQVLDRLRPILQERSARRLG